MIYVLYFIHIVISLFLILVVLLQQGKGADLSVFGGGSSQAAFGARGAATVLHKATVFCFVGFILTTLSIGILKSRGSSSVMSSVEAGAAQTESTGASELAGGELPPEEASEGAAGLAGGTLEDEETTEGDAPEEVPSEDSEPPAEDDQE
ncbi:MAG: preprotein translocase subunit SecG [Acidobacteriota bacterium]